MPRGGATAGGGASSAASSSTTPLASLPSSSSSSRKRQTPSPPPPLPPPTNTRRGSSGRSTTKAGTTAARPLPPRSIGDGGGVGGATTNDVAIQLGCEFDQSEKSFWSFMFHKHERLRSILQEEICLSTTSATRCRLLARINCVHLFNDLVYIGVNHHTNVIGYHRTDRFSSFLEELDHHMVTHRVNSNAAVEEFIRDFRPDFLRYLRQPCMYVCR